MSANIKWRPVNTDAKSIDTWAPSTFQMAMRKAGLELPCSVGKSDSDVLRGLAAAFEGDAPNPYQQILDLLEHHEDIELWAEY